MLNALHTAIVDRLSADIIGLQTCAAYPRLQRKVALPALLVDMEEMEPAALGNEVGDFWLPFTIYCIESPTTPDPELAVRNLAATVALRVQQEADFGSADVVKDAELLRVAPEQFHPDLEGYMVWAVEFRIGVHIGENIWAANPAAGVSVVEITVGDLDNVTTSHSMAAGDDEPAAGDEINLPDQPKG